MQNGYSYFVKYSGAKVIYFALMSIILYTIITTNKHYVNFKNLKTERYRNDWHFHWV